jgi:hypothetical protein
MGYYYDKFHDEFKKKLPKDDQTIERPGNAFLLNIFYMQTIGNELLRPLRKTRCNKSREWMERDEAKDLIKYAAARLTRRTVLPATAENKDYELSDKSLIHRSEKMPTTTIQKKYYLCCKCPHCDKKSAFWEDGTAWKVKPTLCPKV